MPHAHTTGAPTSSRTSESRPGGDHVSIIRAPRSETGFTIVSNDVIRDERLSWRARGILIGILSRPDNWRTDSTQIAREGREGREAVRAALRELETCGYLVRTKRRVNGGRIVTETLVYDQPQEPAGDTEDGFPGAGAPGAGSSGALRSTETKNLEEDEQNRVAAAQRPRTNARAEDRRLWADTIGADRITSDGTGSWEAGTFHVDAFYEAFREGAPQLEAKRWPGRYLDGMYDWRDYLASHGLTINR